MRPGGVEIAPLTSGYDIVEGGLDLSLEQVIADPAAAVAGCRSRLTFTTWQEKRQALKAHPIRSTIRDQLGWGGGPFSGG